MWPNKNDVLDQLYKYTLATKNLGKMEKGEEKKTTKWLELSSTKLFTWNVYNIILILSRQKNSSNICKNLIQELNVGEYSLGNIEEW